MVSINRFQLPSIVLIIVGVYIIVSGFHAYSYLGHETYPHSIKPIDRSEIPAEASIYNYSELSPEAQRAVQAALRADDGSVTVHGKENKPPEFDYSDHARVNRGIYIIRYQENYYELSTLRGAGDGLQPLEFGAYIVGGVVVIEIGRRAFQRDRPRLPLAILVGLAALKGTFLVDLYSLSENTQLVGLLGILVTIGSTAVAWYLLGQSKYWKFQGSP